MRFDSAYWGWCRCCELDLPPLPSPTTWMSGQLHHNLFCWLKVWSRDQHQFANPFTLLLFFVHLSKHTLALYPGTQPLQIGYHLSNSHDMPWKTDSEHVILNTHHQTTAVPPPVSYMAKQRTEDAVTMSPSLPLTVWNHQATWLQFFLLTPALPTCTLLTVPALYIILQIL